MKEVSRISWQRSAFRRRPSGSARKRISTSGDLAEASLFFRGLIIALPISLLLWAGIYVLVRSFL